MPLSDWRTNLAPRPRSYLPIAKPTWREIVDAADWPRHDRGVSKSLWDEACIAMGREEAAIVSATPAEQFTAGRCARVGRISVFHGLNCQALTDRGSGMAWLTGKPARCRGGENDI
jgi:hypothetical protein